MATKSEAAETAIERLEQHGWLQGFYGNKENGYCLMGAVELHQWTYGAVEIVGPVWGTRPRTLDPALPDRLRGYPRIANWNDTPGRTKDEVIEVLTDAAKYWRDRGE